MKNQLHLQEEVSRCLLCDDAPCTKACRAGDPARAIRATRFGNVAVAQEWIRDCSEQDLADAEKACLHYDRPIRISQIAKLLPEATLPNKLPSLEIDFCAVFIGQTAGIVKGAGTTYIVTEQRHVLLSE